jgi:hypothetical protein
VSRLYSLVNVSKVEPIERPRKTRTITTTSFIYSSIYKQHISATERRPLPNAALLSNSLRYSISLHTVRLDSRHIPNERTPDSHYASNFLTHPLLNTAYQNTISVYYIYKLHAYYAYNERSLAYNDYYAYIDLVCIRLYVFLLADLYAKRYVTHQTICIVHSARAAICI